MAHEFLKELLVIEAGEVVGLFWYYCRVVTACLNSRIRIIAEPVNIIIVKGA